MCSPQKSTSDKITLTINQQYHHKLLNKIRILMKCEFVCSVCHFWRDLNAICTHIFCNLPSELNNPSGRRVSLLEDKFLKEKKEKEMKSHPTNQIMNIVNY